MLQKHHPTDPGHRSQCVHSMPFPPRWGVNQRSQQHRGKSKTASGSEQRRLTGAGEQSVEARMTKTANCWCNFKIVYKVRSNVSCDYSRQLLEWKDRGGKIIVCDNLPRKNPTEPVSRLATIISWTFSTRRTDQKSCKHIWLKQIEVNTSEFGYSWWITEVIFSCSCSEEPWRQNGCSAGI